MSNFKGKNNNESTAFQAYQRSRYKQEAFPENNSLGPHGVVDFLFAERNMYGRVDQNLNTVIPVTSTLKRLNSNTNPDGIMAMNFVIDQFSDFSKTFERALNAGKIRQKDPFLSKIEVYKSYESPMILYENYMSGIIENFEDNFIQKNNVLSHQDYFNQFLLYIEKITPMFPITFTAWQRSKYSSIFTTGLAFDISGLDEGDDSLKENFIQSDNFLFYLNACNNHGFSVTKNSPWVMVADLASPASTLYHENYNLSSIKKIFSLQFEQTDVLDFEYIKQFLYTSYNNFLTKSSYLKKFDMCNKRITKNNIYRSNISLTKFNNIYNNNYFIEYYNNIRFLEEEKPFSISDKDKFSQTGKKIQKTFDISRAIGYINEQYRSVYRSKPGGLNSILKKLRYKNQPEEDPNEQRGTSVSSVGSSGGSGGSSGY